MSGVLYEFLSELSSAALREMPLKCVPGPKERKTISAVQILNMRLIEHRRPLPVCLWHVESHSHIEQTLRVEMCVRVCVCVSKYVCMYVSMYVCV